MIIKSLNIGLPGIQVFRHREFITGICKEPRHSPVFLSKLGFEGDGVGDKKQHGGADKAVCVYSVDHYPYWEAILGIKLPSAAFGENLSLTGMKEKDICIGDIYRIGKALVRVSQPRQPCATLAARYGRKDFVKRVVASGRTGFYCQVLEEGLVKAGDQFLLKEKDARMVSIAYANHIYFHDQGNRQGINKVLSVSALSESWRRSFQELKDKTGITL